MTGNRDTALEAAKKIAAEKVSGAGDTQKALKEIQAKVGILSEAGKKLKELAQDFKNLDPKERLLRMGGLVALVTLGFMLKPDDAEHLAEGQGELEEDETLEDTDAEQEYRQHEESGKEKEKDPQNDEIITRQQSAVNMYAIRYYNPDKTLHSNPNQLARICIREKAIPSAYILEKSGALFKEGVGTFENFKKNVTGRLVRKEVKDPEERIRQAAVILSCCAIGRFQIIPTFHFKRMGWPTRGEKGLKAMYEYIRSTDRQIAVFKKIIEGQWKRYRDVGLVAVAYYAGEDTANAYKKNPDAGKFHQKQYAGHASIHEYAQKARNNFNKYKKEIPGLQEIDYVAMVIESNETGKGVIYARAKEGRGISGERVADNSKERMRSQTGTPSGTRPLKQSEVTPEVEAAAIRAQQEMTGQPIGSTKRVDIGGRTYVFQREVHTNRDPNGAPGTTTYIAV